MTNILTLTISVHFHFQTFLESARLTLVSSGYIDNTGTIFLADIIEVSANTSLEEASAAIAAKDAIMLS